MACRLVCYKAETSEFLVLEKLARNFFRTLANLVLVYHGNSLSIVTSVSLLEMYTLAGVKRNPFVVLYF